MYFYALELRPGIILVSDDDETLVSRIILPVLKTYRQTLKPTFNSALPRRTAFDRVSRSRTNLA